MNGNRSVVTRWGVLLMVFSLLAGCRSGGPEAPEVNGLATDNARGPVQMLPAEPPPVPAIAAPIPIGSGTQSDYGDARIQGFEGGELHVGHFRLTVPPGAWVGEGRVSMLVPDRSKLSCQLEVQPASLNQFLVPVTLEARFDDCNVARPDSVLVIWFDPVANRWKQVSTPAGVNLTQRSVVTALWHFSRYAVVDGKAGW